MTEELALIKRVQNGDLSVFKDLMAQHQDRIYFLALGMVGNPHDAEDLMQEVFIKVFRSLPKYRGDAKLSSWIYRIAVNTCIDHCRIMKKKKNVIQTQLDHPDDITLNTVPDEDAVNPEAELEKNMTQKYIDEALQKISPRERAIFILRHYQDMPLKDIANELNITVGTVKSTLFRALKRMQKELSFMRSDLAGRF